MIIKKYLSVLIAITMIITPICNSNNVYGNELTTIENTINKEIVFILDRSGSMSSKDSNNTANELTKMFIDTLSSEDTKVSVIGFTDIIVASTSLTSLDTEKNRNMLKATVDQMTIAGNTDIGLALKEATIILDESNIDSEKMIVLISDGETDLRFSNIRTMEQSNDDEVFAINKSIENDYQISTIGINVSDDEYLRNISSQGNGQTYSMNSTSDLYSVFENLSKDGLNENLKTLDNLAINGVAEDITLNLSNDFIKENNVIVIYDNKLSTIEASEVDLYKSNYYSAVKLENSNNNLDIDSIDLKMVSNGSTNVNVFYSPTSSLVANVLTPQKVNETNFEILVKVYDSNKNVELDESTYRNLVGKLILEESGVIKKMPLEFNTNGRNVLTANVEVIPENQENISVLAKVESNGTLIHSNRIDLSTYNYPPALVNETKINKLLLNENEKVIDLNDYFEDIDRDNLIYEVLDCNEEFLEIATVKNNEITLTTTNEGIEQLLVRVSDDNDGEAYLMLSLSVMPFWIYYKDVTIIIGLGLIILLLLIVILVRRKDKEKVIAVKEDEADTYISQGKNYFRNGRMEGYFLCTKSGNNYPALFWNENHLANKTLITLGELLSFMEIDEKLMEARKIFFEATEKETITFWHRTKGVVYLNNREIENGKQVSLNYDDKMYIVFEDGETEIEIRYKRVTGKTMTRPVERTYF